MTLEHYVDIVLIHQRSQLSTEHNAVRSRMVFTGAVDILVEHHHSPLCVGVLFHSLLHDGLVGSTVVVVGVQNDEQGVAIGVIVIRTGSGSTLSGKTGIVVTDGGGQCIALKSGSIQETGILIFIFGIVDLIACGHQEVGVRVSGQCSFQRDVPVKSIVAGSQIAAHFILFAGNLSLTSADLGVSEQQSLEGVEILSGELDGIAPLTILEVLIVVGGVLFHTFCGNLGSVIGFAFFGGRNADAVSADVLGSLVLSAGKFHGILHVLGKSHANLGGFLGLGIPAEVQLGFIGANGDGHFLIIGFDGFPFGFPVGPCAGLCLLVHGSIVPVLGSCKYGHSGACQHCQSQKGTYQFLAFLHIHPLLSCSV